ncbi:hypothetical protein [Psychrobacillus sp. FJAT-21963]|uniref:hypothetical protein n=1 Tax=Psychrobacillus sp. FJAT-21963 TaxID=1712028 RepID=UPI0006F822C4|nr:hypothetical protein [Psychrobacillus sp. FJAT-21963]KQL37104.1 hypothetical protein AN959_03410 [Psychrobacillus sp. FJAT-21963]
MAKDNYSFRLDDKDIKLLDALVIKLTDLHGTDYKRPAILTMAIRKLAPTYLTEEEINNITK